MLNYHCREEQNQSNNAKRTRGFKRGRQPKRHVSFMSDRTNDDTLADVTTPLEETTTTRTSNKLSPARHALPQR